MTDEDRLNAINKTGFYLKDPPPGGLLLCRHDSRQHGLRVNSVKEAYLHVFEPTIERLDAELPVQFCPDAWTAKDFVWEVRLELDLIEEIQDGTEEYTKRDIQKIRKFLKTWKHLLP